MRPTRLTSMAIRRLLFAAPLLAGVPAWAEEKDAAQVKTEGGETAERVNTAIDRGIGYLLGASEKEQTVHWDDQKRVAGQVALETYALVVAGVDVENPVIRRNFEYLHGRALATGYTYTLACYAFALDAAIAQKEADLALSNPQAAQKFKDNPAIGKEYRGYLEQTIHRLCGLQKSFGGWSYTAEGDGYDNSNTQFAVLALGVGAKRKIPIDPIVWERIVDHFLKCQGQKKEQEVNERLTLMSEEEVNARQFRGKQPKDKVEVEVDAPKNDKEDAEKKDEKKDGKKKGAGSTTVAPSKTKVGPAPPLPEVGTEKIPVYARGWGYSKDNRPEAYWNMSCAGLSSLLLARESLKGRLPPDRIEALNAAVRDGFGWIMRNWTTSAGDYYGVYSLEKVADIAGVRKFGAHDWYQEMSDAIISAQGGDGSWPAGGGHGNVRCTTSYALLVLNRASALVLMTLDSQNPLKKIMVSGKRSNINDPTDRSWVYLQDLDTTIHYPTLLRMIRLRSHPKLLGYLQNIIKYYPDEWKGELIPHMARVRDEIRDKQAKKDIEGYLTEITGYKYEKWDDYLKWHRRWEQVIQIGIAQKKEEIPDLLNYYKSTKRSFPLKKTIIWALQQCKAKEAIPSFLEDLNNPDPRVRLAAYNAFRSFFVEYPPKFDPNGSQTARTDQVAAILDWYQEQQKKDTAAAQTGG